MIVSIHPLHREHVWYNKKTNELLVATPMGFTFRVSYDDILADVYILLGEL